MNVPAVTIANGVGLLRKIEGLPSTGSGQQIERLLLERADGVVNRPIPVTFVMFVVEAAASLSFLGLTAPRLAEVPMLFASIPWLGFTAALTLFCALLFPYGLNLPMPLWPASLQNFIASWHF